MCSNKIQSVFSLLVCVYSSSNCALFAVCFGQHYNHRIERNADASEAILSILENVTFGCGRLDGHILERCHSVN